MTHAAKGVLALFVLGSLLTACGLHGKPHGHQKSEHAKPTAAQTYSASTSRVIAAGIVEPWGGASELSPKESGFITEVLVEEGQLVQRDQLLVQLEDSAQRAAVALAKAELAEAEALFARTLRGSTREELNQARADAEASRLKAELAERERSRTQQLSGQGALAVVEADRTEFEAGTLLALARKSAARLAEIERGARSEDKSAVRERMAAARARLDLATASLERRRVVAPIAGQVLTSRFHSGEYFAIGGAPLIVLGNTGRLRARVEVDEIDAFRVAIGQPCSLHADDNSKLTECTIFRLSPRMGRRGLPLESPTSRADVRVREMFVEVSASDGILPGQRVWAHVTPQLPRHASR